MLARRVGWVGLNHSGENVSNGSLLDPTGKDIVFYWIVWVCSVWLEEVCLTVDLDGQPIKKCETTACLLYL